MRRAASATAVLALLAGEARAGGGPETTVVVVNADSPTSWRIANEYVRLRRIPPGHVCAVEGVPGPGVVPVATFRERILAPLERFLAAQGLDATTDVVAWSADFPYAVDFAGDRGAAGLANPPITPLASLTSLTYLARRVATGDATAYVGMTVNGYYRRYADQGDGPEREMTDAEASLRNEALSHVVEKRWAEAAGAYERLLATWTEDPEAHYNLACCRARTGKPDEAMRSLAAAVAAGWTGVAHTKADPDLASLRDRDDFRALLIRMASAGAGPAQASRGFRATRAWKGRLDPVERPDAADRDRYRLSTMLAWTGPFGNTSGEALASLAASAASDGTDPAGTFYFLANGDVRATTRAPRFAAAVEALAALGRRGEVLSKETPGQTGVLPVGKADVLGAVVGTAGFSWKDAKSRLVPGAIAEHLTSFGAVFSGAGQTKCTEWIRAGAAGSSGTVNEPYSIPHKFPAPHLHVHYAAGCSLAEAYYQSVAGPYQLLILGDPLARPFARFAEVTLDPTKGPVSGAVAVGYRAVPAAGRPLARAELWVDGVLAAEGPPGTPLAWDTAKADDGTHDVRVVVVEEGPIETRSFAGRPFVVGSAAATIAGQKAVTHDQDVALTGRASGARDVQVLSHGREVAVVPVSGGAWKATVPAARLGLGVASLQARARTAEGRAVRSGVLEVRVDPPAIRKATKGGKGEPGLACDAVSSDGKPLPRFVLGDLGGPGLEPVARAIGARATSGVTSIAVSGEFEVPAAGLYQVTVLARGDVEVDVGGRPAIRAAGADPGRPLHALLHLDAGWHALAIRETPRGAPDLTVLLGGDVVTAPLQGKALRHAK